MKRIEQLRNAMRERGLPALIVGSAANRRYLSGFTGSAGTLFVSEEQAVLLTDGRYTTQAAQQSPGWDVLLADAARPAHLHLAELVTQSGITELGFESQHTSVAAFRQQQAAFGENAPVLVPFDGVIEQLRQVKDADEIATLREAIALTDAALAAVLPLLRPDHSELDAAWMLEVALRERGAEAVSFPIIVAAGRNAALPHARPSESLLGEGQPIVIDMGGRLRGYHADLTRTVVLGTPDEQFKRVYGAVLEAQQRAINEIRAGMRGSEADALARDVLAAHDLADYFSHSLGHGVGLDIHEAPSLRFTSTDQVLLAGTVCSIEPGAYLPEWGGVRIEDLVLLHEDGCEVLSHAPKAPWWSE